MKRQNDRTQYPDDTTILCVDDEKNILASLTRLLSPHYRVLTAQDGLSGLELLKQHDVSIVFSDYRMAGMNGLEFLAHVRDVAPDSIRILLTGHREVHIAIEAINVGHVYRYLNKPWDNYELLQTTFQAMEMVSLKRERDQLHQALKEKTIELGALNQNLERIVEERTRQMLQADRLASMGQMAGQIGHEINNVLTLMQGRLQLLQYRCSELSENPDAQKSLQQYQSGIDRLKLFADNLQSLGKPKSITPAPLNLSDVLAHLVGNLVDVGILKNYTIEAEYPAEPACILADRGQLEQMFLNLLINAHHAMDRTGALRINVRESSDAAQYTVEIADTGCGIPEGDIPHIFEPFYTTKGEGKGTGLGMVVVRQVIDALNGSIAVTSIVSQGTTITLHLPRYVRTTVSGPYTSCEKEHIGV